MTTFLSIRSTRFALLALLILGSLVAGCKKSGGSSDPEIDPRDQLVGTYNGGFSVEISIGSIPFDPETGSTVSTITKATNPKQIAIQNNYANGGLIENVTAELQSDGSYLVIDKTTDQITANGKKFNSDYVGSAVFDLKSSTYAYTATSRAMQNGTEVKRTIIVNGTKK